MTTSEAETALENFWDTVKKKYGEDVKLDEQEHRELLRLEHQYSDVKKAEAFNN